MPAGSEKTPQSEFGSTIVTSNLPFEDWTRVLGSEQLTGALLDRLTHHVSIEVDETQMQPSAYT